MEKILILKNKEKYKKRLLREIREELGVETNMMLDVEAATRLYNPEKKRCINCVAFIPYCSKTQSLIESCRQNFKTFLEMIEIKEN